MPTGCKSVYLVMRQSDSSAFSKYPVYLLVISKVVPKIWARTNSAIFSGALVLSLADAARSRNGEFADG